MKKLLLSSIIMFGICGYVTAQNATDPKVSKAKGPVVVNSISPATPQKSASAANAVAPAKTVAATDVQAADKAGKPVDVKSTKPARVKKTAVAATTVGADGVSTEAKLAREKAEAAKVDPVKKTKNN